MKFCFNLVFTLLFISSTIDTQAQNKLSVADAYVKSHLLDKALQKSDIKDWIVSDNYVSKHNGVNHIYYQQTKDGIPVEHAIINVNVLQDGSILNWNSRFISNLEEKAIGNAVVTAENALRTSLKAVDISVPKTINQISQEKNVQQETKYAAFTNIEKELITKLIYVTTENNEVKLCWMSNISVMQPEFHEWKVYVDASTGEFVKRVDQVLHCSFGESQQKCTANHSHARSPELFTSKSTTSSMMAGNYTVFPSPVESPNHGARSVISDPADLTASPFGWHDTDGVAGAEFTITRGNNVHAQDDINGNNGTGYSPDGGASLTFNYTLDLTQEPSVNDPGAENLNSSLTNLFYWNNVIHDVFYLYGFDEVSGNYQENNYGKGGVAGDYVLADGLDGGGTNNANFSPGVDGQNGRMQMFLWNGSSTITFTVNSPANVAGNYGVTSANFGPSTFDLTGDVVEVDDGTANASEGCNALTNGSAISGNVALIDRGNCEFGTKVLNAENAGAIAAIVCNNTAGAPINMGPGADGASVTIPSVMLSQSDCATIRAELGSLNVSLVSASGPNFLDGSFDNGIIAHEYGHGISTRLTGGPSVSCLGNAEQAGEGWSDFFGLVLTHEAGDTRNTARGIGTYATGQNIDGPGIRPFPYTTDMAENPATYDDVKTFSVPHGVGSVFCTMLWDLYWDLIDVYGYDPDIYNGTGGNNIAIQLVMDGLKMQPCSPGFIDARDAILAADRINNGGANQCLIWSTFARRGLGVSATQGSSADRSDGTEGYDIPTGIELEELNVASQLMEGEEVEITGKAICECSAKTDVQLKHIVGSELTVVSVSNGTQNGNEILSNPLNLQPNEEVTISYTIKADVCNPGSTALIFEDDIEGDDNFFSQQINIGGSWVKSTNPVNSGTNAWYAENLSTETDFALVSNIAIPITNSSVLSFYHKYSTEPSWDGGLVEISTDNGSSWLGVEDEFLLNGYPSTININPSSGISGRAAFTGISDDDFDTSDFVESIVDLRSFVGSNILVRFRFASDGFQAGAGLNGWVIDDVQIQDLPFSSIAQEVISSVGQEDTSNSDITIDELHQNIIYVDAMSTGRTFGGDWTNAIKSLQDAIDIAECNANVSEVWVKAGNYIPSDTDINVSFELRSDSKVFGGFAGTETMLSQRDAAVNPTILSGNLGGGLNSFHVVSNSNITNALMDGFTIQDGVGSSFLGGGLYNTNSFVTIRNCRFQNNTAFIGGAVANLMNSNLTLEDCFFFENSSNTNIARAIANSDAQLNLKNIVIIDSLLDGPGNTINNSGETSQLITDGEVEVKKEE